MRILIERATPEHVHDYLVADGTWTRDSDFALQFASVDEARTYARGDGGLDEGAYRIQREYLLDEASDLPVCDEYDPGGYVLTDANGNVIALMDKEMRDALVNHPEVKAAYERWEARKAITVGDAPFELAPGMVIITDPTRDIRGRTIRPARPHWQGLRNRRHGRRKA